MIFSSTIPARQRKTLYFRSDFLGFSPSKSTLTSDTSTALDVGIENPLSPWMSTCLDSESVSHAGHELIRFGWWVEIFTIQPICLYYFGLFDQRLDAILAQDGYLEDLQMEGAEIISVQTKRCQPRKLTLSQLELKSSDFRFLSLLIEER